MPHNIISLQLAAGNRHKASLIAIMVGLPALLLVLLLYLNTSLWLTWALLPASPAGGPAGRQADGQAPARIQAALDIGRLDNRLLTQLMPYIPGELQELVPASTKLSWADYGGEQVVVLIPRLTQQLTIAEYLEREGWEVTRFGLALRLHRPASAVKAIRLPTLPEAGQDYISRLVASRWPTMPAAVVVIEPGSPAAGGPAVIPSLSQSLTLVARAHQQDVHLLFLSGQEEIHHGRLASVPTVDTAVVELTVPGAWLARVPPALQTKWNELIRHKLGLTLTRPNILAELATASWATVQFAGDDIVLGVKSDPGAFKDRITAILQEEERRSRLATKPFRLPDGTIGYEKVPGEARPIFHPTANDNCYMPTIDRPRLWLCHSSEWATVGSSEVQARQVLTRAAMIDTSNPTNWHLRAGELALQRHGFQDTCTGIWCVLQEIAATGRDTRTAARVRIRP
ncbi:MAG: hypothetical protein WEA04_03215 [Candidatus Andersenbacteria bacterium]